MRREFGQAGWEAPFGRESGRLPRNVPPLEGGAPFGGASGRFPRIVPPLETMAPFGRESRGVARASSRLWRPGRLSAENQGRFPRNVPPLERSVSFRSSAVGQTRRSETCSSHRLSKAGILFDRFSPKPGRCAKPGRISFSDAAISPKPGRWSRWPPTSSRLWRESPGWDDPSLQSRDVGPCTQSNIPLLESLGAEPGRRSVSRKREHRRRLAEKVGNAPASGYICWYRAHRKGELPCLILPPCSK